MRKRIDQRQVQRLSHEVRELSHDIQAMLDDVELVLAQLRLRGDAWAALRNSSRRSKTMHGEQHDIYFEVVWDDEEEKIDKMIHEPGTKRDRIREGVQRQEQKIQSILQRLARKKSSDSNESACSI